MSLSMAKMRHHLELKTIKISDCVAYGVVRTHHNLRTRYRVVRTIVRMHAIWLEHIDTRNTRRDTIGLHILLPLLPSVLPIYCFANGVRMPSPVRHSNDKLFNLNNLSESTQIKYNFQVQFPLRFGIICDICAQTHTNTHLCYITICVCPRLSLIDSIINTHTHMHVPPHHTHTSTTAWHGMAFGELFLISQIILFRINLIDAHTGTHAQSTYVCVCVCRSILGIGTGTYMVMSVCIPFHSSCWLSCR